METDRQTESRQTESYPTALCSPTVGKLAAALATAQGEMASASLDATNPHFGSRYATLAAIWAVARGPLARAQLAVVQIPSTDGKALAVRTVLMHSSGEWIAGIVTVAVATAAPQAIGSALTYARRYGLASLCGIAAGDDDDDDGEAAHGRGTGPRPPRPPAVTPAPVGERAAWAATQATAPGARSEVDSEGLAWLISGDGTRAPDWGARLRSAPDIRTLSATAAAIADAVPEGPVRAELRSLYEARRDSMRGSR